MPIAKLILEIEIPHAQSLKDRRQVVRSLKDRLRNGFNLAAQGLPGTGIAVIEPGSEIRASLVMAAGATPVRYDGGGA